ncbi:MAG TPA: ABC transporter ATP-binding protein [Acidimicrobiia bacterium]|nr:ABC transporter ATP-binding protein [Acidimicrobiia bacterium]
MRRMGGHLAVGVDEALSGDEARRVLRRTVRLLEPYRRQVVVASVLLVVQTATMLAGPAIIRFGIDHGIRPRDPGMINAAAVVFLVVVAVGYLAGRSVIWLVARLGESFLRDMRRRVFRHLTNLSLDFYERGKAGVIVSRMTSDVEALQELVSQGLVLFVINALLFAGVVVVLVVMSPLLAAVTLVVVPGVALASSWFRRESNKAYLDLRDAIGDTLTSLQEGLSGVRVVQAYNQEPTLIRRFANTNEAQYTAHLRTISISARYFPVVELAGVGAMAVVLLAGGFMADAGLVSVGTVVAFVLYVNNLFEPIQQLSQLFNQLQQSGAALQKLYDVLDETPTVREREGAIDLPARGSLSVDGVAFAYDRIRVLEGVTLAVEPGSRVALVGPTGAGKSTLAKLMARFYDPVEGAVRYGGVDLRDATLRSLRERIVVVPQEGFLFNGTIRDNVLVGRPEASDDDITAAVGRLGLEERFSAFPDGLDTEVRERGSRLSAGERQLVSLVRAALADPAVVVLDEATSNLDPGTELAVERALDELMRGRTVVVIAHRLSTAARADRIAVVEGGALVEEGTHHDLLARGGRYAALFRSWSAGGPSAVAEPA